MKKRPEARARKTPVARTDAPEPQRGRKRKDKFELPPRDYYEEAKQACYRCDEITRSNAEITLSDSVRSEALTSRLMTQYKGLKKACNTDDEKLRSILNYSNKELDFKRDYAGMGVLCTLEKGGELFPYCLTAIPNKTRFQLLDEFEKDVREGATSKKKEQILRFSYEYRKLQEEAESLYREGRLRELVDFLERRNKKEYATICVTQCKEWDTVSVNWSLSNISASTFLMKLNPFLEYNLKQGIKSLAGSGLLRTDDMSDFFRNAVEYTLALMLKYNEPLDYIFERANSQLDRERRKEIIFNEYEVEGLLSVEGKTERFEKFRKYSAVKREKEHELKKHKLEHYTHWMKISQTTKIRAFLKTEAARPKFEA